MLKFVFIFTVIIIILSKFKYQNIMRHLNLLQYLFIFFYWIKIQKNVSCDIGLPIQDILGIIGFKNLAPRVRNTVSI